MGVESVGNVVELPRHPLLEGGERWRDGLRHPDDRDVLLGGRLSQLVVRGVTVWTL
jgi:hypothetical protein